MVNLENHTFRFRGKKIPVIKLINYVEQNKFQVKELPTKEFRIYFNHVDMAIRWKFNNGEFLNHYRRVERADLRYPIIYIRNSKGEIDGILDGWHRLVKAILEDKKTIKTIEITNQDLKKVADIK